MSIKAIDSQMMITRTPEAARDASIVQQRPDTDQRILAEQQKAQDARDQTRVKETDETEREGIRTDEDGENDGAYDGRGKKNKKQHEEKDERGNPLFLVPPGNNILDIRV